MYQFLASQLVTAACIGLLTIFYIVFLKRETFFRLNRYILLAVLAISLIVPNLKLPVRNEILPNAPIEKIREAVSLTSSAYIKQPGATGIDGIRTETSYMNLAELIGIIYLAGFILSLSLTLLGLIKIFRIRYGADTIIHNGKKLYVIDDKFSTFTFLGMIFIRRRVLDEECSGNIIRHEMVHARQKHSLDILFYEIVKALQWFNPFVYILGLEIRAVHEYIADHATIEETKDRQEYINTLLNQSVGTRALDLANNFNGKTIIKRMEMMMKAKSPRYRVLKYAIMILPVIAVVLVFACNRNSNYPEQTPFRLMNDKTYNELKAIELKMPDEARKNNITAMVILKFTVNTDSSVSNIHVESAKIATSETWATNIGYGLEEEAIRTFKKINGKWKPAIKDRIPIKYDMTDEFLFGEKRQWEKYNSASIRTFFTSSNDKGDFGFGLIYPHSNKKVKGEPMISFIRDSDAGIIFDNLKYPSEAMKKNVDAIVEITFKINDKGEPTDIKAKKDIGYGFAQEAIRVISKLKGFDPYQTFDGKYYLIVPIFFSTNPDKLGKMTNQYKFP